MSGPRKSLRTLRFTLGVMLAAGLAACSAGAPGTSGSGSSGSSADDFPQKPIKWIVPLKAGGGADIIAREIGKESDLKQPIQVENQPGNEAIPGMTAVLSAPADGYTIGNVDTLALAATPYLDETEWKSYRELTPIAAISNGPEVMAVGSGSPYKTLNDLVKAAKAKPNTIRVAVAGPITPSLLLYDDLVSTAGIKLVHVPLKAAVDGIAPLLSGQVDALVTEAGGISGEQAAGKIRPIVVFEEQRLPNAQNVPTARQQGFKDLPTGTNVQIVFGPKGMPKKTVQKLYDAIAKVEKKQSFQAAMKNASLVPYLKSPSEAEEFLKETDTAMKGKTSL